MAYENEVIYYYLQCFATLRLFLAAVNFKRAKLFPVDLGDAGLQIATRKPDGLKTIVINCKTFLL